MQLLKGDRVVDGYRKYYKIIKTYNWFGLTYFNQIEQSWEWQKQTDKLTLANPVSVFLPC